jgi:hypothetical protein
VRREDDVGPKGGSSRSPAQRGNLWDDYHRDPWYVCHYLIFASVFRGNGIGVKCGIRHAGGFSCEIPFMNIDNNCFYRVKQTKQLPPIGRCGGIAIFRFRIPLAWMITGSSRTLLILSSPTAKGYTPQRHEEVSNLLCAATQRLLVTACHAIMRRAMAIFSLSSMFESNCGTIALQAH